MIELRGFSTARHKVGNFLCTPQTSPFDNIDLNTLLLDANRRRGAFDRVLHTNETIRFASRQALLASMTEKGIVVVDSETSQDITYLTDLLVEMDHIKIGGADRN
jgi:hypothetical protein